MGKYFGQTEKVAAITGHTENPVKVKLLKECLISRLVMPRFIILLLFFNNYLTCDIKNNMYYIICKNILFVYKNIPYII